MDGSLGFWIMIGAVTLITLGISLLLKLLFKKKAIIKYIPIFVVWLLSAILFGYGLFFAEAMQDLGYYVMAMITGLSSLIDLIALIIIDYITKNKIK
ncbi:MAG: hypothetical protein WC343_01945 [Bacilli bacterium]|jgi:hypothetical protein